MQKKGCNSMAMGFLNSGKINVDWACTDFIGNPAKCTSCTGDMVLPFDGEYEYKMTACCTTSYPKEEFGGARWYDAYSSQFSWNELEPTSPYAYAKFHLKIKYRNNGSSIPSLPDSIYPSGEPFTSNNESDGSGVTWATDQASWESLGEGCSNTTYLNKKECYLNGGTWNGASPYNVPVVAVFGELNQWSDIDNNGCHSGCSNIKGIYPIFKSELNYDTPPLFANYYTWPMGAYTDLEDDGSSKYPRPSSVDNEILYDMRFHAPGTGNSMRVFKLWDPISEEVYTLGCWNAENGLYWLTNSAIDPETNGTVPIKEITIDLADNTSSYSVTGCTDPNACNYDPCASESCPSADGVHPDCCTYENPGCGECSPWGTSWLWEFYPDCDGDGVWCEDYTPVIACFDVQVPGQAPGVDEVPHSCNGYPNILAGQCSHDNNFKCDPTAGTGDEFCTNYNGGTPSTCESVTGESGAACDCAGEFDDCGNCGTQALLGTMYWGISTQSYYSEMVDCQSDNPVAGCDTHQCNWMNPDSGLDCSCDCGSNTKIISACGVCEEAENVVENGSEGEFWLYIDLDGDGNGSGLVNDGLGKWCCQSGYDSHGSHYAYDCDNSPHECSGCLDSEDGYSVNNSDNPYICLDSGYYYPTLDLCNSSGCSNCSVTGNSDQCASDIFDNCGVCDGDNCTLGINGECDPNLYTISLYDQCGVLRQVMCAVTDNPPPINYGCGGSCPGPDCANPCQRCGDDNNKFPTNPQWNSTCISECDSTQVCCGEETGSSCKTYDSSGFQTDDHCCTGTEQDSNECGLCDGFDQTLIDYRIWPDADQDYLGFGAYSGANSNQEGYCGTPWVGTGNGHPNIEPMLNTHIDNCDTCSCGSPVYVCSDDASSHAGDSSCSNGCPNDGICSLSTSIDCTASKNGCQGDTIRCIDDEYPTCPEDLIVDSCGYCCNPELGDGMFDQETGEPDPNDVCPWAGNSIDNVTYEALPANSRPCNCASQGCGSCNFNIPYTWYVDIDGDGVGYIGPLYYCNGSEPDYVVGSGGDTNDVQHCLNSSYDNYFCCLYPSFCNDGSGGDCNRDICNSCSINSNISGHLQEDNSCFSFVIDTIDPVTDEPVDTYPFICGTGDQIKFKISVSSPLPWNASHPGVIKAGTFNMNVKTGTILQDGTVWWPEHWDSIVNTSPLENNDSIYLFQNLDHHLTCHMSELDRPYFTQILYPVDCSSDTCLTNKTIEFNLEQGVVGCKDSNENCDLQNPQPGQCVCNSNENATHSCADCCIYLSEYFSDRDGDGLGCCQESIYACRDGNGGEEGYSGPHSWTYGDTTVSWPVPNTTSTISSPVETFSNSDYPIHLTIESANAYCWTRGYYSTNIVNLGEVQPDETNQDCYSYIGGMTNYTDFLNDNGNSGTGWNLTTGCDNTIGIIQCVQPEWVVNCSESTGACDCPSSHAYDDCGYCMDPVCQVEDMFNSFYNLVSGATVNFIPTNGMSYTNNPCLTMDGYGDGYIPTNVNWNRSCSGCNTDFQAENYSADYTIGCHGIGGNGVDGSNVNNEFVNDGFACQGRCEWSGGVTDVRCYTDNDCQFSNVGLGVGTCTYDWSDDQSNGCCCIKTEGCLKVENPAYNNGCGESGCVRDCSGNLAWDIETGTGILFIDPIYHTTLDTNVGGTDNTISVVDSSYFTKYQYIRIGTEVMNVSEVDYLNHVVQVQRGLVGTNVTTHSPGAAVYEEVSYGANFGCCLPLQSYSCTDPDAVNYHCYGEYGVIDFAKCPGGNLPADVYSCNQDLYGLGVYDNANPYPGTCGEQKLNPPYINNNSQIITDNVLVVNNFQAQKVGEFPINSCRDDEVKFNTYFESIFYNENGDSE